jgi:hypothetical protein
VPGSARCLTSAAPLSRAPARHRTGHEEPRRRPCGRLRAAEILDRLGSGRNCGSCRWCGAPVLQTNGGPPRHTSGGWPRHTIVAGRDIGAARQATHAVHAA